MVTETGAGLRRHLPHYLLLMRNRTRVKHSNSRGIVHFQSPCWRANSLPRNGIIVVTTKEGSRKGPQAMTSCQQCSAMTSSFRGPFQRSQWSAGAEALQLDSPNR